MPSVEFDLDEFEDEFRAEYCNNSRCLKECYTVSEKVQDYIKNLYNELFIYHDGCKKTVKDIYYDLERIVG